MPVKKQFQRFFLMLIVLLLSSCGGGGGSNSNGNLGNPGEALKPVPFSLNTRPDGVDSTYQGKKTPAQLTQEQSLVFLKTLFAFSVSGIDIENTVSSSGKVAKSYARRVTDSDNGLVSGSYHMTGEFDQRGGVLTAVWKNYSNVEGSLINGKAVFNIVAVNSTGKIIKSTTRYIGINIKDKLQDVLINGYTIEQYNDDNGYTTTIYDVSMLDKKTQKWIALDKLKERINTNYRELNGRLYSSDDGYIDIETQQQLIQCFECEPAHPVEGKLRFRDAHNNSANFTFTPGRGSANKIELVFKAAGQREPEKKKLDWRDFAIWKNENHLPRIARLYDPPFYHDTSQDNYIDSLKLTFESAEKYHDDDGDKATLSYDWYVNGKLITTNHTDSLSVPSFKAGDDIKIKITADDGYQQVSKIVIAQPIRDTRTVISIKPLPEITVGKEIILDASDTYDADTGELSYKWTIGKPGYESWVQVAEAVITGRKNVQTKVKFLESGNYELTLAVSQKKTQGEPTQTSKRIILHVKDDTEKFSPAVYFPHPESQNLFMSLDDITGDGKAEILLTFKDKKEIAIINKVDSYEPSVLKLDKKISAKPLVKDVNADGLKDILVLHERGVSIFTQNSQGDFKENEIEMGIFNKSMITGDFNHDGLIDIAAISEPPSMSLVLLFQKTVDSEAAGIGFYPAVTKQIINTNYYFDYQNPHLTVTDFNQDGIDEIMFWANSELDISDKTIEMLSDFSITDLNADSEILVPPDYLLSFKQENFKLPQAANGEQINDIVFADLNNDKKLEALEVHTWENPPYFYVYSREDAQFNTQQRQKHALSLIEYSKIAVSDVNMDGLDDIYYLSGNALAYHLSNNGNPGTVRHRLKLDSDRQAVFADIGDINGDAKNDIIILYPDKFGVFFAK